MRRGAGIALLLMVAAADAAWAQPAVQQSFDAAAVARDARNWPEALRLLEAIETRTRNPRTLAVIRVRKGTVLVELGRLEEAAAAIRQGLPGLSAGDATLNLDRFLGLSSLGRIAEHDLDYAEALRHYRLAAAIPVADTERLAVQRGIVQTGMFTDAAGALREADLALRLAAAAGLEDRPVTGELHALRGRVLLNLSRFAEARRELQLAQRLLGGMTLRVDRADLVARSDLALAALLDRAPDDARRYLAYTGAGRLERGRFMLNPDSPLPSCGPTLAPDDVAVLEMIVAQDGRVVDVKPVYASRQGPGAVQFARAARGWSFDAASVRDVQPLFRTAVRIEVRCSQHPEPAPARDDEGSAMPGIVPVRCDPGPRRRRFSASARDFPNETVSWGFEGWAVGELTVGRDGRVAQSRTVIAYPPFVFGASALRIVDRSIYEAVDASDNRPCFAGRQRVSFRLPDSN